MDAYSKYVDATFMSPATSHELVTYLTTLFRHFGAPETVVTDNGRQFTSADFAQLCEVHRITHLRCSPYAPQGNGLAEKMVNTLKQSLEQANSLELDKAVAAYNYTPSATLNGKTPAAVFFGRDLRPPFAAFRRTPTSCQRPGKFRSPSSTNITARGAVSSRGGKG